MLDEVKSRVITAMISTRKHHQVQIPVRIRSMRWEAALDRARQLWRFLSPLVAINHGQPRNPPNFMRKKGNSL